MTLSKSCGFPGMTVHLPWPNYPRTDAWQQVVLDQINRETLIAPRSELLKRPAMNHVFTSGMTVAPLKVITGRVDLRSQWLFGANPIPAPFNSIDLREIDRKCRNLRFGNVKWGSRHCISLHIGETATGDSFMATESGRLPYLFQNSFDGRPDRIDPMNRYLTYFREISFHVECLLLPNSPVDSRPSGGDLDCHVPRCSPPPSRKPRMPGPNGSKCRGAGSTAARLSDANIARSRLDADAPAAVRLLCAPLRDPPCR
jgi:hypothetical protein